MIDSCFFLSTAPQTCHTSPVSFLLLEELWNWALRGQVLAPGEGTLPSSSHSHWLVSPGTAPWAGLPRAGIHPFLKSHLTKKWSRGEGCDKWAQGDLKQVSC